MSKSNNPMPKAFYAYLKDRLKNINGVSAVGYVQEDGTPSVLIASSVALHCIPCGFYDDALLKLLKHPRPQQGEGFVLNENGVAEAELSAERSARQIGIWRSYVDRETCGVLRVTDYLYGNPRGNDYVRLLVCGDAARPFHVWVNDAYLKTVDYEGGCIYAVPRGEYKGIEVYQVIINGPENARAFVCPIAVEGQFSNTEQCKAVRAKLDAEHGLLAQAWWRWDEAGRHAED
jgi:hypothetical protein